MDSITDVLDRVNGCYGAPLTTLGFGDELPGLSSEDSASGDDYLLCKPVSPKSINNNKEQDRSDEIWYEEPFSPSPSLIDFVNGINDPDAKGPCSPNTQSSVDDEIHIESAVHFPPEDDDIGRYSDNEAQQVELELKPSAAELNDIHVSPGSSLTTIEIVHEAESILVEDVQVIEDCRDEDLELPAADVERADEPVNSQPKKNKGGRRFVEPRNPNLKSYQNCRNREKAAFEKIRMQVKKLEGLLRLLCKGVIVEKFYKANGINDDIKPVKRKLKRPTAVSDEEKQRRLQEQNAEKCRRYQQKQDKLNTNAMYKRELLMKTLPRAQVLALGIVDIKQEHS